MKVFVIQHFNSLNPQRWGCNLINSFTVSLYLHAGCARDCLWPLKNSGNSLWSQEPTFHCHWGNPNLYSDQPIVKQWCQPIGGRVSFPTNHPNSTRLGLFSSLVKQTQPQLPFWDLFVDTGLFEVTAWTSNHICFTWDVITSPLPMFNGSLTHWGRDEIDAILQTTFSNAFSWMKMFEFRLNFHWSLFLRAQLTIFQHWFR